MSDQLRGSFWIRGCVCRASSIYGRHKDKTSKHFYSPKDILISDTGSYLEGESAKSNPSGQFRKLERSADILAQNSTLKSAPNGNMGGERGSAEDRDSVLSIQVVGA